MTLKFDHALQIVLQRISLPEQQHKDFLKDAEIIAKKIYDTMLEKKSIFAEIFKELKASATYRHNGIIDIPEDFTIIQMYELPFPVQPLLDTMDRRFVRLMSNVKHPMLDNGGFVDGELFEFLLRRNLANVIPKIGPISCTNKRIYTLEHYQSDTELTESKPHTIKAWEKIKNQGKPISIIFEFKPVFKFNIGNVPFPVGSVKEGVQYWFVCPSPKAHEDGRCMLLEVPLLQLVKPEEHSKLRDAIILMLTYNGKNGLLILDVLSLMYVFNGLIQEMDNLEILKRSLGSIFIELIAQNQVCANLLLGTMKREQLEEQKVRTLKCNKALEIFRGYQSLDAVELKHILSAFALK